MLGRVWHPGGVGELIYSAITSLDGYVADAQGKFDWGAPDEEVHRFVNDRVRPAGTHLYGRRMYEVLGRSRPAWSTSFSSSLRRSWSAEGFAGLPRGLRLELELVDGGHFSNGMTQLRYRIQR